MKRCFKCGFTFGLDQFYRHARMADGHLNKCKCCTKSDVTTHRGENLERIREYDRSRAALPHRKALRSAVVTRWAAEHPDRRAAQAAVRRAVQSGRVLRWPACALPECGGSPEAHHPDYSQPLSVVWLCAAHHKQAHALTRLLEST